MVNIQVNIRSLGLPEILIINHRCWDGVKRHNSLSLSLSLSLGLTVYQFNMVDVSVHIYIRSLNLNKVGHQMDYQTAGKLVIYHDDHEKI